jgi:hypothetical protein
MQWHWNIIWQIVPWIVLIPCALLVVAIARKTWNRFRWRRQLEKEIVLEGPCAVLAPIPTPAPIYAKSVALSFPDWDGFSGGVELFAGSEPVARFEVPKRQKNIWTYLIPPILTEWRGDMETAVDRTLPPGELIAKIDGDLRWYKNGGIEKPRREAVLKITVFGEQRPAN